MSFPNKESCFKGAFLVFLLAFCFASLKAIPPLFEVLDFSGFGSPGKSFTPDSETIASGKDVVRGTGEESLVRCDPKEEGGTSLDCERDKDGSLAALDSTEKSFPPLRRLCESLECPCSASL